MARHRRKLRYRKVPFVIVHPQRRVLSHRDTWLRHVLDLPPPILELIEAFCGGSPRETEADLPREAHDIGAPEAEDLSLSDHSAPSSPRWDCDRCSL